jgi:hypothetical protein
LPKSNKATVLLSSDPEFVFEGCFFAPFQMHIDHFCGQGPLATQYATGTCWQVMVIYLSWWFLACERSTFGNDCILSSFFSFILTSNKFYCGPLVDP